ncbi:MAG: ATP-binding protein [Verrucomicrobiota bacterium]
MQPKDTKPPALPAWANEVISLYQSHAASQFVLYGNIHDRFILPAGAEASVGSLTDFLLKVLMPRFDVVISYDLGNGIRIEKGGEVFTQWPSYKEKELPREPRAAIETLTHYFRYCANLSRLGKRPLQIGCWIRGADLVAPAMPGSFHFDLNALATLIRDWSSDNVFTGFPLVTCLLADNINDLHPLLSNNPRAAEIKIPLPTAAELKPALELVKGSYPVALKKFDGQIDQLAALLAGTSLTASESLLKMKEYEKDPLEHDDLVVLKKALVEKECNDLIEFIESRRNLDFLHAQDKLKTWLRQDIALWRQGDLKAMPMGYLICGPVGTGKTFMVECLAGEAGVPVVKIKNFRDKWVGSTEGNLEKIFRLLQSLGRCFVFIDEADQALGKRDSGSNDGGLSGRVYSMFAKEMSNPDNRGKIIWILASSRPDLIEVDLKRPGRVDVKIPIFPTTTTQESFDLIKALSKRLGLVFTPEDFDAVHPLIPTLMTPGAAEALSIKLYRTIKTQGVAPREALGQALATYQSPVAREIMEFQIELAVSEASDKDFVPEMFRRKKAI